MHINSPEPGELITTLEAISTVADRLAVRLASLNILTDFDGKEDDIMESMSNPLRGAVAAKFGNCEAFSKALNWSGRKARDIVSGRQIPTAKDIEQMAEALGVMDDQDAFMSIFFGKVVHNVDE